jgi:hypothetical protein
MMLCQNEEYSPMYYRGRYGPAPSTGQSEIPAVFAPELTNRNPPFATTEGVGDMLRAMQGEVLLADSGAAAAAATMAEELEGADVEPAAAAAIVCLRQVAPNQGLPGTRWLCLTSRSEVGGCAKRPRGTRVRPQLTCWSMLRTLAHAKAVDAIAGREAAGQPGPPKPRSCHR